VRVEFILGAANRMSDVAARYFDRTGEAAGRTMSE
jgi:hypothetical protein